MSLTYFLCGKYSTISILLLIIYWCWLFFMWKCSYHSWLMFMWFSCTERYWWSGWLHLHLSLTYFLCGNYSTISILLLIIYWCWLFFMWKCSYHSWLIFMWFSCTETYWWSGCTSFSFVIYWCWYVALLLLIIYWCWLFFMCKIDWCLCDFLVPKHIDEVDAHNFHLLFTDVDMLHYCFW